MDKIDPLNQVAEFHNTFCHPVLDEPQIPSDDRCKLRVSLIAEELQEFREAIEHKNLVEVADALCDLQYVLAGAILEFGLGEKFRELFDEVQRSNMSKSCSTEEEAKETVKYYKTKKGINSTYDKVDDKWLVYRIEDRKTLKSVNYSPADLKPILNI